MEAGYFAEYVNSVLESDFFPEVFTPIKVDDYFLGSRNSRLEGTILDKMLNSDMDGVWNSKDSRSFAEGWVEAIGNKYGFSDSQKKEILKNLVIAQKTFDSERAKKAIMPLIDAGLTYEAHIDACAYGASNPKIVPGAMQFRDEMLKSGYAIVLNSLSPIEMVQIVGHERLGIPASNCFGTRLFDENHKILAEPEFNFSPTKRINTDVYKPQHGLTERTLEITLGDEISDAQMRSRIGLHPFILVANANDNLPLGTKLKFPEGRECIFPLAKKIKQYEVALVEIALGKDVRSSCRKSLEIRRLFEELKNNQSREKILSESIRNFMQSKIPAMQYGSCERINSLLNRAAMKSQTDKIKIFEKILYEELKTYTFEFGSSAEVVEKISNFN